MAKVRAIRVCFVDNGLRQEGDVFEYNGPKNTNLEYLDGEPKVEAAAPAAVTADEPADKPAKKWTPKAKRASGADQGSV